MEGEQRDGSPSRKERKDPGASKQDVAAAAPESPCNAPPRQKPARAARGSSKSTQPLKNTLTKLEKLVLRNEVKLTALLGTQQTLQAKLLAMQYWFAALEDLATGTCALREAGAAAASSERSGGHWRFQEQIVTECLSQLQDLRQHLGAESVLPRGTDNAAQDSHSAGGEGNSGGNEVGDGGTTRECSVSASASSGDSSGTTDSRSRRQQQRLRWQEKLLEDGETAEAALARFEAHTPESVAKCCRAFVRTSAVDLCQVKGAEADMLGAGLRLQSGLERAMALTAGLLVANPLAYVRAHTLRWDTLQPIDAEAPPELWGRCVQQMELTLEQELVTAAILEKWRTTIAPVIARREQLLQRQRESSSCRATTAAAEEAGSGLGVGLRLDAGDEEDLLLTEVERCNAEYLWRVTSFAFALFSHVFTPQQSAALFVNAFPYPPMLMSIEAGLQQVKATREAAAGEGRAAAVKPRS